jgi:hypothetical protein
MVVDVRAFALFLVLALLALGAGPARAASPGLTLGFMDDGVLKLADPGARATGLEHGKQAGASVWRLEIGWRGISPTKPPSLAQARDPRWSGYQWSRTDDLVRAIASAGMEPLAVVSGAPDWAEGPGRPASVRAGSWRPSPVWFEAFAAAVASRYSGSLRDPSGATLPKIRRWEAWNEPNLAVFLTPQWSRAGSGWKTASPGIYRGLLNAFYRGVKSVAPGDVVAGGVTAPYGDLEVPGARIPPARFWRDLLCVRGRVHPKAGRCASTSFDAISHHPYPIGPPRRHARNPDDVVVPDLAKITKVVSAAVKAGTVRPRAAKPVWATEISWDSRPDPDGLTLEDQAQYLEGALYVLWKQGARLVTWFGARDEAPTPSYAATFQAGVFLRGATTAEDKPKPSFTAFRFPFTAYRGEGVARLWGIAPAPGAVTIQARSGAGWVTAAPATAGANRVFTGRLRVGRATVLRAVQGNDASLAWTTF